METPSVPNGLGKPGFSEAGPAVSNSVVSSVGGPARRVTNGETKGKTPRNSHLKPSHQGAGKTLH